MDETQTQCKLNEQNGLFVQYDKIKEEIEISENFYFSDCSNYSTISTNYPIKTEAIEKEFLNDDELSIAAVCTTEKGSNLHQVLSCIKEEHVISDTSDASNLTLEKSTTISPDESSSTEKKSETSIPTQAYCSKCDKRSPVTPRQSRCQICKTALVFECLTCRKIVMTSNSLRYHLESIHLYRNIFYQCPDCPSKLSTARLLMAHRKYCGKEVALNCKFCPYVARHSANLRYHIRNKHTVVNYECDNCGRKYGNEKSVKRHMKYYCGKEKRFRCAHCSFRAYRKDQLPAHLRAKHGELFMKSCKRFKWGE